MKKDEILENAKDRDEERLIKLKSKDQNSKTLFIKSSSDIGTLRNMGRRGSLYAPQAILNIVKKLSHHNQANWSDIEIASATLESKDFNLAQKNDSEKIAQLITKHSKIIHLGGGHDHIYPLLMGLNKTHKNITVINIDAHLDTRTDEFYHSGTPFRQFSNDFDGEFTLIQLGILDLANTESTMLELLRGTELIYRYNELKKATNGFRDNTAIFEEIIPYNSETTYVLSLDADALDAGIMEGVSAVNHKGLSYDFVEDLFLYAKDNLKTNYFGIYEYNPVYDNLSQKGARALSSLIYEIL